MTDAPTEPVKEWPTERIVLLVAAAGTIVGSLGPWVVAQSGFGSISVGGMDGDGKITAIGGILIALCAFGRRYIPGVILSGVTVAVALCSYRDVQDRIDSIDTDLVRGSIGWGLYAVLAGAAVAFVLCADALTKARRVAKQVKHAATIKPELAP